MHEKRMGKEKTGVEMVNDKIKKVGMKRHFFISTNKHLTKITHNSKIGQTKWCEHCHK